MTKVVKYPVYPITFAYVNGIFFGLNFELPYLFVLILLIAGIFSFWWIHRKQLRNSFKTTYVAVNHLAIYIIFASLGHLSFGFHNQKTIINDLSQNEFQIEVEEVLKSNAYSHRMYAKLLNDETQSKVLVTFSKENPAPHNGHIYQVRGTIQEVAEPRNLQDFNYKEFLARKKIHYRIQSNDKVVKIAENKSLMIYIDDFRLFLMNRFSAMGYDAKTKGFIEALLLVLKLIWMKKYNNSLKIWEFFIFWLFPVCT